MLMGGIAITLFAGLVALALITGVKYAEDACHLVGFANCETEPQRSLIAQIAAATFGNNSILFFVDPGGDRAVLLLAANTAFNGFPLLGSVLAKDGYAPKALSTRGDRLIFSNGVIALSIVAAAIIVVYQANVTALIQLYIIGVFTSFTLGQIGMVKHWIGILRRGGAQPEGRHRRAPHQRRRCAVFTAVVLIIVTITKFTHGAWLVFVIMPILWFLMLGVNRYYRDVVEGARDRPSHAVRCRGRPRDRAGRADAEAGAQGTRLRDRSTAHLARSGARLDRREVDDEAREGVGRSRTSRCRSA